MAWYEQILDELPVAVFLKDCDGIYRYVNRRFLDTFPVGDDLQAHDVLGKSDADFLDAGTAADYEHKDRQVINGTGFRSIVEELAISDGTAEFHQTTKLPVHHLDGEIAGLLAISMEITEPVRAAQAHSISERRYRLATQASRDGVWELDLTTRKIELSARASRLLHVPVTEDAVDSAGIFTILDNGARTDLYQQFAAINSAKGEVLSTRNTVALHDGEVRTLQIDAAPLYDNDVATHLIGSFADVTDAVANEQRLRHLAEHDDLTGLANRRALLARLDEAIAQTGWQHTLLYLDLDDFKLVNDSFGHTSGDKMLVEVGHRLVAAARPNDLVARVGGDEFALLLSSERSEASQEPAAIGERILRSLQVPIDIDDVTMWASASIGVLGLDGYETSEEVMRDADTAMYSAKVDKATVHTFEVRMRTDAVHRHQLTNSLRRAVRAKEFALAYQPLVNAPTREVGAVEALLRWSPNGTPISPAEFLPTLEDTGLIIDLGEWIIDEACRQLSAWQLAGLADLTMSINLSRVQVSQPDLDGIIADAARRHSLSPADLTFEITETAIAANTTQLVEVLGRIRNLGCKIAIDDFGVGQSCLSQLHILPADVLKIDQSFVRRIENVQDHNDPVLDVILQLAHALEMSTVAEGVETRDQADWLSTRGCDVLQGYHFARPMFPDVIDEMISGPRLELETLDHPA